MYIYREREKEKETDRETDRLDTYRFSGYIWIPSLVKVKSIL